MRVFYVPAELGIAAADAGRQPVANQGAGDGRGNISAIVGADGCVAPGREGVGRGARDVVDGAGEGAATVEGALRALHDLDPLQVKNPEVGDELALEVDA